MNNVQNDTVLNICRFHNVNYPKKFFNRYLSVHVTKRATNETKTHTHIRTYIVPLCMMHMHRTSCNCFRHFHWIFKQYYVGLLLLLMVLLHCTPALQCNCIDAHHAVTIHKYNAFANTHTPTQQQTK